MSIRHLRRLAASRAALALLPGLCLSACSSLPDADPIADQMRRGGNCAPAEPAAATPSWPSILTPPSQSLSNAPAHSPPHTPALPKLDLQGQLSIKLAAFADQPAKGLSLGFFFSGNTESGQLDLMTLMGSQMAQINWLPGEAWLTNDKGRTRYDNLEILSDAVLGEQLPLRPLIHWMQGQPDPEQPSQTGPEANTFIQAGWLIDTSELPARKLHARRAASSVQRGVQLKIYLDR